MNVVKGTGVGKGVVKIGINHNLNETDFVYSCKIELRIRFYTRDTITRFQDIYIYIYYYITRNL